LVKLQVKYSQNLTNNATIHKILETSELSVIQKQSLKSIAHQKATNKRQEIKNLTP
jgi:hypothetical protein